MAFVGVIAIIALKFIVPVFMPFFPFQAIWGNFVLDVVDGDLLGALGLHNETYQLVDKVADYWSYVFLIIAGRNWKIRKTLYALFAYRTIGQILFFLTQKEVYLFYFQNFLEPLAMIYILLIVRFKSEEKAYAYYKNHLGILWSIIIVYKFVNEWLLHSANIDLSLLFFGLNGNK